MQPVFAQIQKRGKKVVVARHGVVQTQYSQGGLCQGNGDPAHHDKVVCALEICVFKQFFGDALKGAAQDHDVVRADQHGQDHSPTAVVQPQPGHDHVGGNQAAGKIHRERKQEIQLFAQKELSAA